MCVCEIAHVCVNVCVREAMCVHVYTRLCMCHACVCG